MSQPTILITGGAGYIGSHTAKAVRAAGMVPVVYDNLSNGHVEAVLWGPFIQGDIRDRSALCSAMEQHAVSGVINFAGLIEVGRSVIEPAVFWDHNVAGMAAVLDAMRTTGVQRLVFSSTAAVYGRPLSTTRSLRETDATVPINPYGDTKLACERMIAAYCAAYDLSAVALRYFNAAGADCDGQIGEAHMPESHLIPLAVEAGLGVGRPLTVFGETFGTLDGTCVRDFVHVEDLASAHVVALSLPMPAGKFEAMNLGTGQGYSVREVLAAVARTLGRPVPHAIGPRRAGDPDRLVADASIARDRLGWQPKRSDLQAIVASAVAWRRAPTFGLATAPEKVAA